MRNGGLAQRRKSENRVAHHIALRGLAATDPTWVRSCEYRLKVAGPDGRRCRTNRNTPKPSSASSIRDRSQLQLLSAAGSSYALRQHARARRALHTAKGEQAEKTMSECQRASSMPPASAVWCADLSISVSTYLANAREVMRMVPDRRVD